MVPDSLVACSEKPGGVGALKDISSMGKYSGHGKPPPNEIRPGVFKYWAAPLRLEGWRERLSRVNLSEMVSLFHRKRQVPTHNPTV